MQTLIRAIFVWTWRTWIVMRRIKLRYFIAENFDMSLEKSIWSVGLVDPAEAVGVNRHGYLADHRGLAKDKIGIEAGRFCFEVPAPTCAAQLSERI